MTPPELHLPARYGPPTFVAEGAFGRVYRAALPEGPVAVKVLAAHHLGDPDTVWAFGAEARRLAGLAHPAFPALVEQGVTADGRPFYAMAFLPGAPPAPGVEVRAVLAELARAIAYLHGQGLTHGDLKPENVLVDGARVSLLDVGMARPFGDRRTAVAGTLEYAAPEVLRLADVAPEADWYAFGALAYALLAGHPPFVADARGPGELVRRQLLEPPAPLPAGTDPELAAAVLGLLAKDPLERARELPRMLGLLGLDHVTARGLAPARWQPRAEVSQAWAALATPGAVVALEGPQGAGKSHALDALRLEASLAGTPWLGVSCGEAGGAPGGVARLLLRQALAAAGQVAEGTLAAWLAGEVPAAWLDLEPRPRKLALQAVVAEAWQAATAKLGHPRVGLDDFAAADATSQELIAQLFAGTASWCLTGAPAEGRTVIELAAWTPAEVRELVASRLGEAPPPAMLEALAAVEADGPGLVNALVDHWFAGGALRPSAAGWEFEPAALVAGAADPWEALWREKLGRLGPAAGRLAGVLAAFTELGPLPAWALGQALGLGPEALQAGLDDLTRAGVASAGPVGVRLAPMPAAALPAAPGDVRALATGLARVLAGQGGLAGLVLAAGLAVRGEDDALALELGAEAGRQALEHLALDDAARLLGEARSRLDDRIPASRRLAIHLAAAEVERLLDRKDEATADLEAALALAEAVHDDRAAATALAGLAKGKQLAGAYAEGLELAQRALALAERADVPALAARAAMVAARIQVFNGELGRARASCARAAELAAAGQAPVIRSHALNLQGVLVVQEAPDQREQGLALIREALALTEAAGDLLGTSAALENLGNAFMAVGELREAEDAFARCAAICAANHVVAEGLSAEMNLALVRAELGEPSAYALAGEVAARAQQLGRAFVRSIALAVQGQAAWRAARFEEAFALLDEALAAVLAIKNRFAEEYIRLYRLEAYVAAGALAEARAEAGAVAEVVAHTQHAEGQHKLALYRARLALLEGDLPAASALAEPLLAVGHAGLAYGAYHVLGQFEAAREVAAPWRSPWHAATDELALARVAADASTAVAHARAALATGASPFARAGAACVLAALGHADVSAAAAVRELLGALPAASRDAVLAAQGLPPADVLAELAATPAGPPSAFPAWLARVLDAPDERGINEAVLDATLALTQADRGYLLEYEHGRLVQVVSQGLDYAAELAQGFSSSIVEEVLLTGEPVYSFDAATDERWSGAASVHALGLRTVVALPYGTPRRLLGVVYVDRAAVDPVLGPDELHVLDLLARTGAERVAALRLEQDLLGELAFEREVAQAALAMSRSPDAAGRRAALLAAALRLTGAERAFWLVDDAGWQALAAQDAAGQPLAFEPGKLSSSVLARTVAERSTICLVEHDEPEGWKPGASVLALGLRMVWSLPATPDAREVIYLDTQRLTAVDPQRLAGRLTAMVERLHLLDH